MVSGWTEVELLSLSNGGMQNGVFYEVSRKGHGIPLINVGDMYTHVPITTESLELFDATDDEIKRFAVNDGDLFFTRSSVVPSGIAFCNWYKKADAKEVVFDSHVIRFKTDTAKVVPMFLYLQCVSSKARKFFVANAKTATMTTIDQEIMGKCLIDIPSLPEQRAIAAVISDVDGYIVALERLIAKKRNIKIGAMQELLTGKRRLPGFDGEWADTTLGDCFIKIVGGGTPARGIAAYWNGRIPWVTVKDFATFSPTETQEYISELGLKNSATHLIPKGTLITSTRMGLGRIVVYAVDVTINQDLKALFVADNIERDYIMYWFAFNARFIEDLGTGSTVKGIRIEQLREIDIIIPPTKAEQTAIAAILSDMDAEIDMLTAKLIKVRNIKQGMIQELLSGRIRLVSEARETEAAPMAKPASKVIEMPKRKTQNAAVQTGGHNQKFDDAVMIAGIVNVLYHPDFPLGRKKVQKCLYLLRRRQDQSTAAFKKKAAGPYADEVRYKGGEPIARSAKYITTTVGKRGTTFSCGGNISQALGYIQSWRRQADIKWVADNLRFKKVDELELLATVDMAICDLENEGIPVSVASIKHLIATNAEWKAKLKKQTFSDANIARAIQELQTLLQGGN